jgi:hypothetical protein
MKTLPVRVRRALALVVTLPLLAITSWGLSLALRPASSTGPKSLVQEAHPARSKSALAKLPGFSPLEIQNFGTTLCLQPVNESTAQGAAIVQQPCTGHTAQQWTKVTVSGNILHFMNGLSGLCLDARGSAVNHTPVQQWTCNKISNENWEPGQVDDDDIPPLYSRVSGATNYCLDVPGGQKIAGLAMQIYRCNGTLAQIWFTP